jgi:prepilin-type N-terminal cleavage/methylation domain-containing protein
MRHARSLPRRRDAFTLIELLVVMVLVLVLAALGLGYVVFGQDNQHSVSGAQAITGALLNAKQRARRDGLPTGVRIIFGPTTQSPNAPMTQATQLQLIQQPDDYNAGQVATTGTNVQTGIQFAGVDFQGGAQTIGDIDESTVEPGDYFLLGGTQTVHRIMKVYYSGVSNNVPTIDLASPVASITVGDAYSILRAPRRLPSEDVIQLPPGVVIDNGTIQGNATTYCQNLPQNTTSGFAEIVFAPSGAVVGQGTGADKVYLWLRDPNTKAAAFVPNVQYPGSPLILSVQIRTGLIGVYPVAPWPYGSPIAPGNDPYAYVKSPRASGL